MGSEIQLDSQPGRGSVFSFSLPLRLEKDHNQQARSLDVASERDCLDQPGYLADIKGLPNLEVLNQAKILVVDDNDFNIQVVGDLLRAANSQVQVVPTGEKAVQKVQQHVYDAVLMDVQMSGIDGNRTTRMIREMKGLDDLPIIGLSARSTREDRELGLQSGMNAYLVKPVMPEQLYQTLIHMLQGNPEASSSYQASLQSDTSLMPEEARQDPEAFRRLVRRFMRNYKDAPEQLRNLNKRGEGQKIQAILHSLVNALGVMGAGKLSTQSRQLEQEIKKTGTVEPRQLQVFVLSLEAHIHELKKTDIS
jgi:CheY-like chemotaxis protein